MEILPVSPVSPNYGLGPVDSQGNKVQKSASFGEMLNRALEEVNAAQVRADQLEIKFLTGEVQELHQVIIAMEQARLMTSLAVEVRNRLVEAYQEIARMQI